MATPEGRVKDAVRKALAEHGVFQFTKAGQMDPSKVNGTYWMPVQGPYAVAGVHDFVGCWLGVFFSIETKSPDNPVDATANQEQFRVAVNTAGGVAVVGARDASCVDAIAAIIKDIISGRTK